MSGRNVKGGRGLLSDARAEKRWLTHRGTGAPTAMLLVEHSGSSSTMKAGR